MWTRAVVERHVFGRQPLQVSPTQNNHVIETLASHTTQQTFANGIGFWCCDRRAQQTDASPFNDVDKLMTILAVVIAEQEAWPFPKRCRLTYLLGDPGIGWGAGDPDLHHTPCAQLNDEKQEDASEEHIVGLQKVARPNFMGVVRDKCGPSLRLL